MFKNIGLSLAIALMLGPAYGQTDAPKVKPKNDALDVCVPSYIAKYAVLCETAEVAARGVAYACSPKPMPKGPTLGDPNSRYELGRAWDHIIQEGAHELAYGKALVGILDARAIKQPVCPRS